MPANREPAMDASSAAAEGVDVMQSLKDLERATDRALKVRDETIRRLWLEVASQSSLLQEAREAIRQVIHARYGLYPTGVRDEDKPIWLLYLRDKGLLSTLPASPTQPEEKKS